MSKGHIINLFFGGQPQQQPLELLPPAIAVVHIYRCTPLALYLFVSVKNKTQTELERTEQCAGIEGAQFEIFKQIR